MSALADNLVPVTLFITLFVTPGVVIAIWLQLRYRQRRDLMQLVDKLAAQGQTLSPELAETLSAPPQPNRERDLRRGVLLLAIALAMLGLGVITGELQGLGGAALFPALLGAAYLLFWTRGHDATA